MNKKTIGFTLLLIGAAALLYYLGGQQLYENSKASHMDTETTAQTPKNSSSSDWASNAKTVRELMLKSDLVVRARVSEEPVTRVVPIKPLDDQGQVIEGVVHKILFSDTLFEVLETYVGKPSATITVMQTGGFDLTVSKGVEEDAEDPLYKIGEEYILFLVDISGDPIHAPDRELYITVNPYGRYRIDNGNFFMYGQNSQEPYKFPTSIIDLEIQIDRAARELNK